MAGAPPGERSRRILKHIALLIQRPLDARDYRRFGIDVFRRRGARVSVVDAADLLHPMLEHDRTHYSGLKGIDIHHAGTGAELKAAQDVLGDADLVLNLAATGCVTKASLGMFRIMARAGSPYAVNVANAYPGCERETATATPAGRLADAWSRRREIDPVNSLLARLPLDWLGAKPASYVIHGGSRSFSTRLAGPDTVGIHAHAMDYDIYLEESARDRQPTGTAVFIDEYRPYHSDVLAYGYDRIVEPETYFTEIRALFDRIEREMGLEVVIAACPRADYSDKPGVFGDRRIEEQSTARLVAESSLVLAHRSTAISFAIMFKKPVMQIATRDNYEHPSQKPYFDGFQHIFGKPIQFYENAGDVDLSVALDLDAGAYARYMAEYIKRPGSPEKAFWEIVADAVERDNEPGARKAA